MGEPNKTREYLAKYANPETAEAIIAKTALQMANPTGVSSYPDVANAAWNFYDNPSWSGGGELAMEVVGALPLMGKVALPYKAAKSAKLLNRIGDVNKAIQKIDDLNKLNKKVDTFAELIPGVRRVAEHTQDMTSKFLTHPIFNKYASKNKFDRMRDYRNYNIGIDLLNTTGTALDAYQGVSQLLDK